VKPSPNTARVNFTSKNLATTASVLMWAPVTITDVVKTYRGTFKATYQTVVLTGTATWTLKSISDGKLNYEVAGSADLNGFPGCTGPGVVPLLPAGSLLSINAEPATNAAGVASYDYLGGIDTTPAPISCGSASVPNAHWLLLICGSSKTSDIRRLKSSCDDGYQNEWDFIAVD
jgi:hypothetical protein